MSKTPKNQGKQWTPQQEKKLRDLAAGNTPTPLIAHELGRSVEAVRSKASELGQPLKPTNQSPYNRRKK